MGVVTAVYMLACMVLRLGTWTFVSAGGFWMGLVYARCHEKIQRILQRGCVGKWCTKGFAACFGLVIIFQGLSAVGLIAPLAEQECSILASLLLLCVFWYWMPKIRFGNKALGYIGEISYELYLIHRLPLTLFRLPGFAIGHDGIYAIVCTGVSILAAIGLHRLFHGMLAAFVRQKSVRKNKLPAAGKAVKNF